MKNNVKIFVFMLLGLLAASCGRKAEYRYEPYITFDARKYSVAEDAGTLQIPVTVYNPTGKDMQIIVRSVDNTAVEGKDYEIVYPNAGVLTFSGEETTQEIEVKIIPHLGEFTKALDFSLEIEAADYATSVGNVNTISCTINDDDHPLKNFLGDWTGTAKSMVYNESYPMEITITENSSDETYMSVRIENFEPSLSMYGTSAKLTAETNADRTQLSIRSGQYAGFDSAAGSCSIYALTASADGSFKMEDAIVLNLSSDKKSMKISGMFGSVLTSGDYAGYLYDIYEPGLVLTRR